MFAQFIDFDQAQHLEQDETIEAIYLEGIGDGFNGRLPMRNKQNYLWFAVNAIFQTMG